MNRNSMLSFGGIALMSLFILVTSKQNEYDVNFKEKAKLGLRDVAHKLLKADKDSSSLVLPVSKLSEGLYTVSFQTPIAIQPEILVTTVDNSFRNAGLPDQYRIEVLRLPKKEVVYSFEVNNGKESDIIPCIGRDLLKDNYEFKVRFTSIDIDNNANSAFMYVSIIGLFGFLIFTYYKKDITIKTDELSQDGIAIGSFKFIPKQNKLYNKYHRYSLSKKECEILEILVRQQNLIVSREVLNKEVWEDKGVIVGRSLDTYISKLRKKLKSDSAITIKNIHGIGYKLEVSQLYSGTFIKS